MRSNVWKILRALMNKWSPIWERSIAWRINPQTKHEMANGGRFVSASLALMQWPAVNVDTMQTRYFGRFRNNLKKKHSLILPCLVLVLVSLFTSSSAQSQEPSETVRIESDLVDLKINVLG